MRTLPFAYAFRNLGRSPVRLVASLAGAALVTLLLLASGGFVRGMQRTLTQPEPLHENVLLLGAGSEESLERSQLDANVTTIAAASVPGLKSAGGVAFVSPELNVALPLHISAEAGDADGHDAVLRGVTNTAFLVHPEVEVVAGRLPVAGADELLVGALAATRMSLDDDAVAIGRTLYLDGRPFAIVGRFAAPRTVMNAEVWVPLPDLQIATRRESTLSAVVLGLEPGRGRFADADLFAKSRLDLELVALREADYHASLSRFYRPIRVVVVLTAALIGIGGLLGGLNTTYAAFASRVREIGMLQALGYPRRAIVLNLTQESLFAAACGTAIGMAVGWRCSTAWASASRWVPSRSRSTRRSCSSRWRPGWASGWLVPSRPRSRACACRSRRRSSRTEPRVRPGRAEPRMTRMIRMEQSPTDGFGEPANLDSRGPCAKSRETHNGPRRTTLGIRNIRPVRGLPRSAP